MIKRGFSIRIMIKKETRHTIYLKMKKLQKIKEILQYFF